MRVLDHEMVQQRAAQGFSPLKENVLALCGQIKALLSGEPHREKIQTQLTLFPVEALQAAGQIRIAGCSEEERAKLVALIRALQR